MLKNILKNKYVPIILVVLTIISTACTANTSSLTKETNSNESPESNVQVQEVKMAVEYNTHASCAFVAQENGQLAQEGSFDVYATGVALAGALSQGEVDAAYICLVPAITAYANGSVPIKIVCGTHKYGYGLIINKDKINELKDLEKEGIKIACVREGGTTDVFLHKIIEKNGLDTDKVMKNVLRMNPAKQVMAIRRNQVDAIVVPEHFASMADEDQDLEMIIRAQDIWPDMQGSILVVTEDYLQNSPEDVKKLYTATEQATQFINENTKEAAEKVSNRLNLFENDLDIDLEKIAEGGDDFTVKNNMIEKSMNNMEFSTSLDKAAVQEVIDYVYKLGYIKETFSADDIILDQE